ncbi:flavodoxin [Helicobacter saguini]|uniref:Flavodoxin n=1 Tax=Helicobacter saguini TaxID=1548018 RepID=A0A347VMY4_9HELI|nr:flavodoxin [Helicobacter saguini]MWV61977.1 flavodoxin [Helicobacter saguini]MWV67348.1 flavodoxin [Helicobacter saguini]MWV69701.1 flavodoxin [Helicobacter saguini]MWV73082.1 flavodoxin [Helicobacter saguini]TLD95548.1 flavodoxin [Helicobacter saguini]
MSIGIFVGSDNGTTTEVCEKLASKLGDAKLIDVASAKPSDIAGYDKIILASSTWGDGELQSDWDSFADALKGDNVSFAGKTVALLALGDADSYSETFCDALYHLKNIAKDAKIVGETSTSGYEFDSSKGAKDGKFFGLAIDEVNQDDKTEDRLDAWAKQLKSEGF